MVSRRKRKDYWGVMIRDFGESGLEAGGVVGGLVPATELLFCT